MQSISIVEAIILGFIQGATEFLPISSSGHLVLAQRLFGVALENGSMLTFDICLHFGTLLAVAIYFRQDLWNILRAFFGATTPVVPVDPDESPALIGAVARRMAALLIIGTIPAVAIGLGFKHFFDEIFESGSTVPYEFLITGTVMWCTRYVRRSNVGLEGLRWGKAWVIGCAQAFAILPAISRSGMTIAAGLFLHLDRALAARFSFLLSIPALGGAMVLGLRDARQFHSSDITAALVGTGVSFIVGYATIKWLMGIVRRGNFSWFAVYCWAIGVFSFFVMR